MNCPYQWTLIEVAARHCKRQNGEGSSLHRKAAMNRRTPYGVRGFSPAFGAGLQSPPKTMEHRMLTNGRDKQVPPEVRRGTLVVPDTRKTKWIFPALTSERDERVPPEVRRGTLVVPDEQEWMIERRTADLTGRSLREADPTSGSLRMWTNRTTRDPALRNRRSAGTIMLFEQNSSFRGARPACPFPGVAKLSGGRCLGAFCVGRLTSRTS